MARLSHKTPAAPEPDPVPGSAAPQRGGCLTLWLAFMVVGFALDSVYSLLFREQILELQPNLPAHYFDAVLAINMLNISCVVALFRWRRWGFYGIVLTTVALLILNASAGMGGLHALRTALGPVLLFALLQIGGECKAWNHLR